MIPDYFNNDMLVLLYIEFILNCCFVLSCFIVFYLGIIGTTTTTYFTNEKLLSIMDKKLFFNRDIAPLKSHAENRPLPSMFYTEELKVHDFCVLFCFFKKRKRTFLYSLQLPGPPPFTSQQLSPSEHFLGHGG